MKYILHPDKNQEICFTLLIIGNSISYSSGVFFLSFQIPFDIIVSSLFFLLLSFLWKTTFIYCCLILCIKCPKIWQWQCLVLDYYYCCCCYYYYYYLKKDTFWSEKMDLLLYSVTHTNHWNCHGSNNSLLHDILSIFSYKCYICIVFFNKKSY